MVSYRRQSQGWKSSEHFSAPRPVLGPSLRQRAGLGSASSQRARKTHKLKLKLERTESCSAWDNVTEPRATAAVTRWSCHARKWRKLPLQVTPTHAVVGIALFFTAKLEQHKQGISLGRTFMLGWDKINRLGSDICLYYILVCTFYCDIFKFFLCAPLLNLILLSIIIIILS